MTTLALGLLIITAAVIAVIRRVAAPILAGMAAVILTGMLMKSFGWWAAPTAVPAAASARSHP